MDVFRKQVGQTVDLQLRLWHIPFVVGALSYDYVLQLQVINGMNVVAAGMMLPFAAAVQRVSSAS